MLNDLTFEKVEEIIRLANAARDNPQGRASDPQHGEASGDDGLARPGTPPEPQPADTWLEAFKRYLHDLSDAALTELIVLYHFGRKEDATTEATSPNPTAGETSHTERIDFLTSRADLIASLQAALGRL